MFENNFVKPREINLNLELRFFKKFSGEELFDKIVNAFGKNLGNGMAEIQGKIILKFTMNSCDDFDDQEKIMLLTWEAVYDETTLDFTILQMELESYITASKVPFVNYLKIFGDCVATSTKQNVYVNR